jgi:hypothetical protein
LRRDCVASADTKNSHGTDRSDPGSRSNNLVFTSAGDRSNLARYDAIMVMDDDIVIDATGITRLFEIRRERDLWALQPAFRLGGKVSWDITAVHATAKLRYTNFIENACLHTLGTELDSRVAVVDEVTCINPYDRSKLRRISQSPLGAAAGLLCNFPHWAYFNAKRLARRLVPRATRPQR